MIRILLAALMLLATPAYAQNVSKGDVQRLRLDEITLDGTTVTATGAEINIIDGVTATTAELNRLDDSAVTFTSAAGGAGSSELRFTKTTVAVSSLNSTVTVLPAISGLKYYIRHIDAVANNTVATCTDVVFEANGQGQTIATMSATSIATDDVINFSSAASPNPTSEPVNFTSAKLFGSVANTAILANPTGTCGTATQITFGIWYALAP